MGLTTSCETIGRLANPVEGCDAKSEADVAEDEARAALRGSNAQPIINRADRGTISAAVQNSAKRQKCVPVKKEQSARPRQRKGRCRRKSISQNGATTNKETPSTAEVGEESSSFAALDTGQAKINPHRARILVGKQALAAIKNGTRLYIKSGEGNGGDTWWDSGVIQKIHSRGKPYEVEWEMFNNKGEEVETEVEKRVILPVTYSLAGVAVEAIAAAAPGTEDVARKRVLANARIGSWCIHHPAEPWGTLNPFDNILIPDLDPSCETPCV